MSIKQHHLEWLKLLDVSGPFLSPKVLSSTFPQGLDEIDPTVYRKLKLEVEDFEINPTNEQVRYLSRFVLNEILGFSSEVLKSESEILENFTADFPEHSEKVAPDFIVYNPDYEALENPGEARIFFKLYDPSISLDRPTKDSPWKASPSAKVTDSIRVLSLELAIITNGSHWMLIYAPKGQNTTYASWYSNIWFEEKITIRSFKTLLSFHRLFGVTPEESLEGLFVSSQADQEELTDKLGKQVLRSVELLVGAIDKIDKDTGRELLKGFDEKKLYEASVTVMMRLIFMLAAEERDLFFLGESFYDENYAISTLVDKLQEDSDRLGEDVLERRSDAWTRILATFRAVYGGVNHQVMRLPAYGGGLFDPDRFPFLEGRTSESNWERDPAKPLTINNLEVLYLLKSIQYLEAGTSEARRLSFRALDVEQIGYIYEGLLDHTAKRANEVTVSLVGSKDNEPEVPLSILQSWFEESEEKFIEEFKKLTKRTDNSIKKSLSYNPTDNDKRLLAHSCENDQHLIERCLGFYGFIRKDSFGYPVVIHPGSVYVTEGEDRRSSGTHYTPKVLTEPVVQFTLEPLVYNGPKEGKEKKDWTLKTPEEILDLKICDIACGSAAFLVQACRYLSERLVESWAEREKFFFNQIITYPYGMPQTDGIFQQGIIEKDEEKRLLDARRYIVSRCLYGVDKNPLAVEMAKLSMWLITMEKGKPFSFVDHSIKCGDSIVGFIDENDFKKRIEECGTFDSYLISKKWSNTISSASKLRQDLENTPGFTIGDVKKKNQLLNFLDNELMEIKKILDSYVFFLFSEFEKSKDGKCLTFISRNAEDVFEDSKLQKLKDKFKLEHIFHWFIEFPEVFLRKEKGFDAVIGNPPFKGGKKISNYLGKEYRDFLVKYLANNQSGSCDLCAYFYLKIDKLVSLNGIYGLVATNSIAQGETREISLDNIIKNSKIIRAESSIKWPGTANVEVSLTWIAREYSGVFILNGNNVKAITAYLKKDSLITKDPFELQSNLNISFQGVIVFGSDAFCLVNSEIEFLKKNELPSLKLIKGYIGGKDILDNYDLSPSRSIVDFSDFPLERSNDHESINWSAQEIKDNLKIGIVDRKYEGSVVSDFPVLRKIVERRILESRSTGSESVRQYNWWKYWRPRSELYQAIQPINKVLVKTQVSSTWFWAFTSKDYVIDAKLIAFAFDDFGHFGVLQSELHFIWSVQFMTTMKKDITYSPERLFRTFPFPSDASFPLINTIAEELYLFREQYMLKNKLGATKLYNQINDIRNQTPDIVKLRELHHSLDKAVLDSYGWGDIELKYEYQVIWNKTKLSFKEEVKDQILEKLYLLNKQRAANGN